MGKATCCQVQWPESDPQDLYGRRGEWSCLLVSRCVLHGVNICKQNIENCNKNKSNYHSRQDKMYGCKQAPTCPLRQLAPSQTSNTSYVGSSRSAIQPDTLPLQSAVSQSSSCWGIILHICSSQSSKSSFSGLAQCRHHFLYSFLLNIGDPEGLFWLHIFLVQ